VLLLCVEPLELLPMLVCVGLLASPLTLLVVAQLTLVVLLYIVQLVSVL
jgi:hypothetical protein